MVTSEIEVLTGLEGSHASLMHLQPEQTRQSKWPRTQTKLSSMWQHRNVCDRVDHGKRPENLEKVTRIKKEKHRTTDNRGKANEDQVGFQKPSHLQDSKQNHSEDKKCWKRKLLFSEQPYESTLTESLEGSLVYSSEGW
jgi:hypothetical protein